MGTLFGSGLWGGGANAAAAGAIKLGTGILNPAFRIAGITLRPMRTPSPDQYAESIPMLNRLVGSWNCDRLDIFSIQPAIYPLKPDQLEYTIGPGANFNAPAPQRITDANIILPGTPPLRSPVEILDEPAWAAIRLQLIPGAITSAIYPDYNFPIGKIYLYGQPPAGYSLEIYTWQTIPVFGAIGDAVVLPPGYERALVYNLALELADAYPSQADLSPRAPEIAAMSLAAIESRNAPVPRLSNDAAGLSDSNRNSEGWNWWRTGGYGN